MAGVRAPLSSTPLLLALVVLSLGPLSFSCRAQAADAAVEAKQQPAADMQAGFEPAAGQEYELGSGDEVSIEVSGHPELSGKHIIGPDGRVTMPVVGDVQLAGRTRSQAGKDVHFLLSNFYKDVSVSVRVEHYTSNRIMLIGAVEHPGLMTFDGTPTLLEVISRGGIVPPAMQGVSGSAIGARAFSAPLTIPEMCIIYRTGQPAVAVPLRSLLKNGDPQANMRLRRDDVVFVPGNNAYVSVLGNVVRPGMLRLESSSTLLQLLAESGGVSDKGGQNPQIFIVHAGSPEVAGKIDTVFFKDVLKSKPNHLVFSSGDVIYVPESGFNHVADVLVKLSPLFNLVTVGALLGK